MKIFSSTDTADYSTRAIGVHNTAATLRDAREYHGTMGGYLLDLGMDGGGWACCVCDEDSAVELRHHLGGAVYLRTLAPSFDEMDEEWAFYTAAED